MGGLQSKPPPQSQLVTVAISGESQCGKTSLVTAASLPSSSSSRTPRESHARPDTGEDEEPPRTGFDDDGHVVVHVETGMAQDRVALRLLDLSHSDVGLQEGILTVGVDVLLLAFALTGTAELEQLCARHRPLIDAATITYLVGTRSDLVSPDDEEQRHAERAAVFAKKSGFRFVATSSVTGDGMQQLFQSLAEDGRRMMGVGDLFSSTSATKPPLGKFFRATGPGVVENKSVSLSLDFKEDQSCTVVEALAVANSFMTPPCYEGTGIWSFNPRTATITITFQHYFHYGPVNVMARSRAPTVRKNLGSKTLVLGPDDMRTFLRSQSGAPPACCSTRRSTDGLPT